MDSEGNPFKLKLYSPLKNTTKGVYLAKGGNILEGECIVEAKEQSPFNYISFTISTKV